MKILHYVSSLNYGGIQKMLLEIYKNIDRTEYHFDFLISDSEQTKIAFQLKELGADIFYITPGRKNIFKKKKEIKRFINNHKNEYTAIHIHTSLLSEIFLINIAKRKKIKKIIIHSHSSSSKNDKSFQRLFELIHKINRIRIQKKVTDKIAVSDLAGKWMYGEKNSFTILKNPIEVSKFLFNIDSRINMRKKLGIEKDEIVIGHIGRIIEVKNQEFIIKIFDQFYKNNLNSKLILIGDGPKRSEIEKMIIKFSLEEKVLLLGMRYDIQNLLCVMDIMVFPSLYEGFPITLLEAQASNLPIIASNVITESIKLSPLVKFLSLTESEFLWANEVFLHLEKYKTLNRGCFENGLIEAGYDIKDVIKSYEKLYNNNIN